jgi:hypothetical protein
MTRPTLTPQEFVDKWRRAELKESSAAQEHFNDLCRMFGHRTPGTDSKGESEKDWNRTEKILG